VEEEEELKVSPKEFDGREAHGQACESGRKRDARHHVCAGDPSAPSCTKPPSVRQSVLPKCLEEGERGKWWTGVGQWWGWVCVRVCCKRSVQRARQHAVRQCVPPTDQEKEG